MNYSKAVLLVHDKILVVKGKYEENQKPTLFKTLDSTLKKDDYAVVESSTRWGITTVKITEVGPEVAGEVDFDSPEKMEWVVGKINIDSHKAIKELEEQAVNAIKVGELRKRRKDIIANTLDAAAAGELGDKFAEKIAALAPPPVVVPSTMP